MVVGCGGRLNVVNKTSSRNKSRRKTSTQNPESPQNVPLFDPLSLIFGKRFCRYCGSEGLIEPEGLCGAGHYCALGSKSPIPAEDTDASVGGLCAAGYACVEVNTRVRENCRRTGPHYGVFPQVLWYVPVQIDRAVIHAVLEYDDTGTF